MSEQLKGYRMDNGNANEVFQDEPNTLGTPQTGTMEPAEALRLKSVDWPQEQKIIAVKSSIAVAISAVKEYCPRSTEASIALTKLEEASMWATKAIANPQ